MITTRIIPVATATSQELLVEITEPTCRPFCVGGIQPSATVAFTAGSPTLLNGNAIVPIVATITIVTPSDKACGCAHTQVFTEKFDLAFEATATNAVTIAAGANNLVVPTNIKCCQARAIKLTTTLTATIA